MESSKTKQKSNLLLKIVNLLQQRVSKRGAVRGFVILVGFARGISAAGQDAVAESPSEAPGEGGSSGPAALSQGAQPGKGAARSCHHHS